MPVCVWWLCAGGPVCLFIREHICGTTRPNFFVRATYGCSSVPLGRRVGIRYVLPLLWMTSHFPITGPAEPLPMHRRQYSEYVTAAS